jgi:DNA invertase Pin-like site-specific DNA recombinase
MSRFKIKKDAYIYVRVSSQRQTKNNVSFDTQINACQKYIKEQNYKFIQTLSETGSAFHPGKRHQLDDLIDNIPEDSVIIVYSYDRFSRNVIEATQMIQKLSKRNVLVESATEKVDYTTPNGRHLFTTIISSAQQQSETLGKRIKSSIEFRKNNGTYHTRTAYGYINVQRFDKYFVEEDPEEMKIIQIIISLRQGSKTIDQINGSLFEIVTQQNQVPLEFFEGDKKITKIRPNELKFKEIADILNDYNITHRNKPWSATNVSYLYGKFSGDTVNLTKKLHKLSLKKEDNNRKKRVRVI